ncbi:MAG: sialate O-acetylesterase [Verrucomicrobiota bacterium]
MYQLAVQNSLKNLGVLLVILIAALSSVSHATSMSVNLSATGGASIESGVYRATIDKNGCMPDLTIGNQAFIKPGVAHFTRGIYLFSNKKVVPLKQQSKEGSNSIVAKSDNVSLRYTFAENAISFAIENSKQKTVSFFMVFDKAVNSLKTEDGKSFSLPLGNRGLQNMTFVSGSNRLKSLSKAKLWPFNGHQAYQVDIKPGASANLEFAIGGGQVSPAPKNNEESYASVSEEKTSYVDSDEEAEVSEWITINSPANFQVFQRQSLESGMFAIKASLSESPDSIEYRIVGQSINGELPAKWKSLEFDPNSQTIHSNITVEAGGWYRLELQAKMGEEISDIASVKKFGMGEVFIGAGQSNSTSCGEFRTSPVSGMVANFTGKTWRLAEDPQLGSADQKKKGCDGGSYYPAFGDALYAEYKVPIGVSPTGCTGTSVRYWQPNGGLYRGLLRRIKALGEGGFRAVLWHQGETDMDLKLSKDEYFKLLKNTIEQTRKNAGWEVPWFVAHVSYPNTPKNNPIRSAQASLWDKGIAEQGPDTDPLKGDYRDRTGVHFSPKGLKKHGELWAEKVSTWLSSELAVAYR